MIRMILMDPAGGQEFLFPVTPESFSVSHGRAVQKIDLHEMGEINLFGQPKASSIKVEALLPSSDRPYAFPGGYTGNPYGAVELLKGWIDGKKVLRYIISDTPVNLSVLPDSLDYGEQDGTGDVFLTLTLQEYRTVGAVQVQSGSQAGTAAREQASGGTRQSEQSVTVARGDTLWAIARKYYGDPSLCWKLASYNGIPNANLIWPGQVVRLPDKSLL